MCFISYGLIDLEPTNSLSSRNPRSLSMPSLLPETTNGIFPMDIRNFKIYCIIASLK